MKAKQTGPVATTSPPIQPPTPYTDENALRVADVWRAVLGLPRDFPIDPMQVTVCMAAAQLLVERTVRPHA